MTQITKLDPVESARTLNAGFGEITPHQQRIAVGLYRALARGQPVTAEALAADLGLIPADVAGALDSWPGVFRGEDGAVVGFWGVGIPEMPHRFEVDGTRLYTWCAWDSLFIPVILGRTAHVTSRDPSSEEPVSLVVRPDGVESATPLPTVVSLLEIESLDLDDIVSTFCHFIHFFGSPESGAAWASRNPGTFIVSLEDAFRLGEELVRLRYGAALEAF